MACIYDILHVIVCACSIWRVSDWFKFCMDLSAIILCKNLSKFHLVAQAVNCYAILEVYFMFLTNCAHSIFLILPSQLSQFKGKYSSFRLHLFKNGIFNYFEWFKRQFATTFMTSSAISVVNLFKFLLLHVTINQRFFI